MVRRGDDETLFTGFSDEIFDSFIAKPIFPVAFMDMVFEDGNILFRNGLRFVDPLFIGFERWPSEHSFKQRGHHLESFAQVSFQFRAQDKLLFSGQNSLDLV